jgi:hypothetical protein
MCFANGCALKEVGTVSAYHILLADGAAVVVALTNELLCPTGKRGNIRHDSSEREESLRPRKPNGLLIGTKKICKITVREVLSITYQPSRTRAQRLLSSLSMISSAGFIHRTRIINVLLQRLRIFSVARVLHVRPM